MRVPEELLPGHRVHKAEAGVAVDEGQPAAQFPQRAQPQPADAQSLQGQRVGAAEGGEGSAAEKAAHPLPLPPQQGLPLEPLGNPRPHLPRSLYPLPLCQMLTRAERGPGSLAGSGRH